MYRVGNDEHYFRVGLSALECIESALHIAKKSTDDIKSILDLPCGYGRVLRTLKAAFPGATVTACDISKDGVDFCKNILGAKPLYSKTNFRIFKMPENMISFFVVHYLHILIPLAGKVFFLSLNLFLKEKEFLYLQHTGVLR